MELKPVAAEPAPAPAPAPADPNTVTVSTHVADDPATGAGASLVARTRVSLEGDVEVFVTRDETLLRDGELLQLHQETLAQALEARLAYLKLQAKKR